ncbi:MAG: protein kinase [Tannerella sp.]|jgi:serine/threonine-protein kinase|nr:protein kinase [Tannerella sp.]
MKISIYDVKDEPVGYGGMGRVYQGIDPRGNTVAIKEMRAEFVTDAHMRARFHKEAVTLAQLEHPSIVKMHSSFEERGCLYLVMEYVEGETVEQCVKRKGIIDESEAVRLLSDVLSALDYAHANGLVHRDIKPGNIMIRPDRSACLLDFGIVKDLNDGSLTTARLVIGTDGYMSPEQAEGYHVDRRSDIYSLGCVLFYMLTGRHAIPRQKSDYDTRQAVIQNALPKAKDFNPCVSDALQAVLDRAMNRNMLMRFQSCREFGMELRSGATAVTGRSGNAVISIGREECDIVIIHSSVSRHHADMEAVRCPDGIIYRFMDRSTNGTTIDGEKIHLAMKEIPVLQNAQRRPSILLAGTAGLEWTEIEAAFGKKSGGGGEAPPPPPPPPSVSGKDATGWLVAIYTFAVLGGVVGIILGTHVYRSKITLPDGRKVYRYRESHRTAAQAGALLSCLSFITWQLIRIL